MNYEYLFSAVDAYYSGTGAIKLLFGGKESVRLGAFDLHDPAAVAERCQLFRRYIADGEAAAAFDVLYVPEMPVVAEHRMLLSLFVNEAPLLLRLRRDQTATLLDDARNGMPTAQFVFGSWLSFSALSTDDLAYAIELLTAAAKAGWADAYAALDYAYRSGLNDTGCIQPEKAADCHESALRLGSVRAYVYSMRTLLYGWNGTTPDPSQALSDLQRRIDSDGGVEACDPRLSVCLAECYLRLGQYDTAREMSLKGLSQGVIERAFITYFSATCNPIPTDSPKYNRQFQEVLAMGINAGSSFAFYLRAKDAHDDAKETNDKLRCADARCDYMVAALLGEDAACLALALAANNGELGFDGKKVQHALPFFVRGAMAGNAECAYWTMCLHNRAGITGIDDCDRIVLPEYFEPKDPQRWQDIARSLYAYNNEEWPGDDDIQPMPFGDISTLDAPDAASSGTEQPTVTAAADEPWTTVQLSIHWQADRHSEEHTITFERPTADNPTPEHPIVEGEALSIRRLSMSSEWGQLFAAVKVKSIEDDALAITYGQTEHRLTPGKGITLDTGGMNYTTFWLLIRVI